MKNEDMKSNINLAEKVYTKNDNEENLENEKILGYKIPNKDKSASFQLNLTYMNEKDLIKSIPCTENNKLNEQTFGVVKVDDEIVWSCRCENVECEGYEDCMRLPNSKRIERDYIDIEGVFNNVTTNEQVDESVFVEQEENRAKSDINAEKLHFVDTAYNYTKIDNTKPIIETELKERIIVNSSNVTAKTEAIVKKIEYVITNNLVQSTESILVLCCTKSTKRTIEEKLAQNEKVTVYTIDEFATESLHEIKEIEDSEILTLSDKERIEKYNLYITKFDISKYELLIADEVHEFENQRAMMLLNIIRKINAGVLLLGDKSQVLYSETEISTPVSIDTVKMYNLLNLILPRTTIKYELLTDMSEAKEHEIIYENIRNGLLYKTLYECKKITVKEFEKVEMHTQTIEKFKPKIKSNETLALVCKSESEAEYVSSILYKNKIHHNLIRSLENKYSYNRWIADVLWDHCSNLIQKDDFVERYKARILDNEEKALHIFELLLEFTEESFDSNRLNKEILLSKLTNGNKTYDEFTNKNDRQITVATVLNSKSNLYDQVYLVDFELENLFNEEIKINRIHEIYVALLRAKQSVKMINFKQNVNFKNTTKKRPYRTYKKYNNEQCTHFCIGNDIAPECFITGNFKDVLKGQRYISEIVKVNDKVELILEGDEYHIYHIQNTRTSQKLTEHIGVISSEAFTDIKEVISNYNEGILPHRLYDLYVSQIVTVPQNNTKKDVAVQFKNSKFMIGIEISGFAKIEWL